MKTKKNLRITACCKIFTVIVLLGVSMFTKVLAQSVIPAHLPDNPVGQSGYPNSSTIDYSNYNCGFPNPQLTAMVVDGGFPGCPNPTLWMSDNSILGPLWLPAPIPAPAGCAPDVVIGNDASSCSGGYLITVVATVLCSTGTGSQVMLYTYRVPGSAPFFAPPILINICSISDCSAVGVAHIDIIDEYSNLVGIACATPMAFANKFVVTWQSNTKGIMAYYANLNNPCNGITQVINPNLNLISPDVAAVERTGCTGFRDFALFSYIDPTTPAGANTLYEQEWDITLGPSGLGPVAILDNTKTYVNFFPFTSYERIDAIDDYNFNSPAGGNAYFDVVASASAGGGAAAIYEYNNLAGSGSIASAAFPPPISNYTPQVACGPGQKYTVVYFSNGTAAPGYYATGVDWGTGALTPPGDAYQINLNPWAPSNCSPWGVCVSTSHNIDVCGGAPSQETFTGFESNAVIWEKYSANPCFPYAFKPSKTPGTSDEWKVSPNPTSDNITLVAPDGFTTDDGTTYSITDLTGKTIKQSKVNSANEQVSVKDLTPGMYLININKSDKITKTIKFVKE